MSSNHACSVRVILQKPVYYAGEYIEGLVHLTLDRIVTTRVIEFNIVWSNHSNFDTTLLHSRIAGEDKGPLLQFGPGSLQFPFSFTLPDSFPPTFKDTNFNRLFTTKLVYYFEAVIHHEEVESVRHSLLGREVIRLKDVAPLFGQLEPSSVQLAQFLTPECLSSQKSYTFSHGSISFEATVSRKLVVSPNKQQIPGVSIKGEKTCIKPLEVLVSFKNNTTFAVNRVTVALIQSVKVGDQIIAESRILKKEVTSETPISAVATFTGTVLVEIPGDLAPTVISDQMLVNYKLIIEFYVDSVLSFNERLEMPLIVIQENEKFEELLTDPSLLHKPLEIPTTVLSSSGTMQIQAMQGLIWEDEKCVLLCLSCSKYFTKADTKYHCRLCGRVFCGDCCVNQRVDELGGETVRVCKFCKPPDIFY